MSFRDLSQSENQADRAKADSAELADRLQTKTHRLVDGKLESWRDGPRMAEPVAGEFTPQTAGLAVLHDSVVLKGGPFDGQETKVPRGAVLHERPAANPGGFYPARYRRSGKRTEDGLTVFQFQEPAIAPSPA
jgi:hypothetical protein